MEIDVRMKHISSTIMATRLDGRCKTNNKAMMELTWNVYVLSGLQS